MAGREMPRKVFGIEKPNKKIFLLSPVSNGRAQEKTKMLSLEMQRKDKRPQKQAPPRKFQQYIREKIAILVVKHYNRAREVKISSLDKALSREVGLNNLSRGLQPIFCHEIQNLVVKTHWK